MTELKLRVLERESNLAVLPDAFREAMREAGFKVALIGEGSDEFNLGYYHKFPGLKLDKEICESRVALAVACRQTSRIAAHPFHSRRIWQSRTPACCRDSMNRR